MIGHPVPLAVKLLLDELGIRLAVEGPDVAMIGHPVPLAFQRSQVALELARALCAVPHACGRKQSHIARPLREEEAVATLTTLVIFRAMKRKADRPGEQIG